MARGTRTDSWRRRRRRGWFLVSVYLLNQTCLSFAFVSKDLVGGPSLLSEACELPVRPLRTRTGRHRRLLLGESNREVDSDGDGDEVKSRDDEGGDGNGKRVSSGGGARLRRPGAPPPRCDSEARAKSKAAPEGTRGRASMIGGEGGEAPRYDGSALARVVFADPYFYTTALAAAKKEGARAEVLGEFTVRQVLEIFYTDEMDEDGETDESGLGGQEDSRPLRALSRAIGARLSRIRAYHRTADLATKQFLASFRLRAKYGCDFDEAVIGVGSTLDPLRSESVGAPAAQQNRRATGATGGDQSTLPFSADEFSRTVDMSFLRSLRLDEDDRFFVPATVLVRDSMRMIFGLFDEDIEAKKKPGAKNTVLIGSPGVGKSILFFLASLYQAQSRMVLYYRVTKTEEDMVSIFVIVPDGEAGVRVWFTRNMERRRLNDQGGITRVSIYVENSLGIQRDEYYAYIDGPNHMDDSNLMAGTYDYLCTSGGFPLYKDGEIRKRRWVLDGWNREDAIASLEAEGYGEAVANDAYDLCGGNIRRMLAACESMEPVREVLDGVIGQQGSKAMLLAMQSTERSTDPFSVDSLRTMFFDKRQQQRKEGNWKGVMFAVQVVDSKYALNQLANEMSIDAFLESYRFCRNYDMMSSAGGFFERIVHRSVKQLANQSVKTTKACPVQRVCWPDGRTKESLQQLNETGVYWIPSVSNFVSIDAALVHEHTLYSFQMTIKDRRDFNVASFRSMFADQVKEAFRLRHRIDELVVYIVVPKGSKFVSLSCLRFTDGKNTLSEKPNGVKFLIHKVNMEDLDKILQSTSRLMSKIQLPALGVDVSQEDESQGE